MELANSVLSTLNEIFSKHCVGSNGRNFINFKDIKDESVVESVVERETALVLFNLLQQCSTPYEEGVSREKLHTRWLLLEALDSLMRIHQYGLFIVENCFEQVMSFFADNLIKAKDWCALLSRGDPKEAYKLTLRDLFQVLFMLGQIFGEEVEDSAPRGQH